MEGQESAATLTAPPVVSTVNGTGPRTIDSFWDRAGVPNASDQAPYSPSNSMAPAVPKRRPRRTVGTIVTAVFGILVVLRYGGIAVAGLMLADQSATQNEFTTRFNALQDKMLIQYKAREAALAKLKKNPNSKAYIASTDRWSKESLALKEELAKIPNVPASSAQLRQDTLNYLQADSIAYAHLSHGMKTKNRAELEKAGKDAERAERLLKRMVDQIDSTNAELNRRFNR